MLAQLTISSSSFGYGEMAALLTACCWTISAIAFADGGRRIGSNHLNRIRLIFAVLLLVAATLALGLPLGIPPIQAAFMAGSGLVGLALGDAAYFESLVILGVRRAALVQTLAPALTALLMIPLLGETMTVTGVAGMLVTIGGVAWVVSERSTPGETRGNVWLGAMLALLGALGQAGGLVLAKPGLGRANPDSWFSQTFELAPRATDTEMLSGVEIHPVYGTLIRMGAALAALLAVNLLRRDTGEMLGKMRDRKATGIIFLGAMFGPFIGVALAMYAIGHTNPAVASTLMSISPVLIIPAVALIYGERITLRSVVGAIVAVVGVGILAFRNEIRDVVAAM